jgi:hypothetical protein
VTLKGRQKRDSDPSGDHPDDLDRAKKSMLDKHESETIMPALRQHVTART